MTERDLKILQFISDTRYCTHKQIKDALFSNVSDRVCYRRLDYLADSKLIKRSYYHIDKKNIYIYYLDKKPKKRILKHDLLITQFYVELLKCGFDVIEFDKNPSIQGIVPDAIAKFRTNNNSVKSTFLEIQLSGHDCINKYYGIKNKTEEDLPSTLYIVTNSELNIPKSRKLSIVADDTNFKKLKFYFS